MSALRNELQMHIRTFTQRRTYGDMWLRADGDSRGSASVALPCLENVPMVNRLDVARSLSSKRPPFLKSPEFCS